MRFLRRRAKWLSRSTSPILFWLTASSLTSGSTSWWQVSSPSGSTSLRTASWGSPPGPTPTRWRTWPTTTSTSPTTPSTRSVLWDHFKNGIYIIFLRTIPNLSIMRFPENTLDTSGTWKPCGNILMRFSRLTGDRFGRRPRTFVSRQFCAAMITSGPRWRPRSAPTTTATSCLGLTWCLTTSWSPGWLRSTIFPRSLQTPLTHL